MRAVRGPDLGDQCGPTAGRDLFATTGSSDPAGNPIGPHVDAAHAILGNVEFLWVIVALLVFAGRVGLAQAFAAVTVVATIIAAVLAPGWTVFAQVLVGASLILALGAARPEVRKPFLRWLFPIASGLVAVQLGYFLNLLILDAAFWRGIDQLTFLLIVVAFMAVGSFAYRKNIQASDRSIVSFAVMAAICGVTLALMLVRLATLRDLLWASPASAGPGHALLVVAWVEVVVLASTAALTGLWAAAEMRRLPEVAYRDISETLTVH